METATATKPATAQQAVAQVTYYKPSEVIQIVNNHIAQAAINTRLTGLVGVYFKSEKVYGSVAFDRIRDEDAAETLTCRIPVKLRDELKNGNLVFVMGTIDRSARQDGSIQITLNVSRVNKIQDATISEEDMKREEARQRKIAQPAKNVDLAIEELLFKEQRPQIALVYAEGSITNADFEAGLAAAKAHIDFHESRVSFANPKAFSTLLRQLDAKGFTAIAIVRGGGSGLDKLDDLEVVNALADLRTPWIYGVGHVKEKLFIQKLADKLIPIPFALGSYFRDITEKVIAKRNDSVAVLSNQIKKYYETQIVNSNNKNAELNKQLQAAQLLNKKQAEDFNKQISQLSAESKKNTDAFEKAKKEAAEQNSSLQKQLADQRLSIDNLRKSQDEQMKVMKSSLDNLQKSNDQLTSTNKELSAQLTSSQESFNKTVKDLSSQCDTLKRQSEKAEAASQANSRKTKLTIILALAAQAATLLAVALF